MTATSAANMTSSLTVIVCTWSRPMDLRRCIESIAQAEAPDGPVEVLIIVDRDAPLDDSELRALVQGRGYVYRCIRNPGPHGLVHSRFLGIREAVSDVILFVDDDVEVEPPYLSRLVRTYAQHAQVGAGGVDTLTRRIGPIARLYRRFFLIDSGSPGRFSLSGFNGSVDYWIDENRPFETEFLSGCNMSFYKSALIDVKPQTWLHGYCHCEDMVLSEEARKKGSLFVYPDLRVAHHLSPESRFPPVWNAYTRIYNVYEFLNLRRASWRSYAALYWSGLGMVLKNAIRPRRWPLVPPHLRAMRDMSTDLWRRTVKQG